MPSRDLDVVAAADVHTLGEELAACLGGSVATLGGESRVLPGMGRADRIVRVVLPSDGESRWTVDLAPLEGAVEDDLARRDFTVDAIAVPVEQWELPLRPDEAVDPHHGRRDLERGLVRAMGPKVFRDEPGRLLRAVRLAAVLGFRLEDGTESLVRADAGLAADVPGERLRGELLAILALDGAKRHLEMLDGLGLLCCIIPELGDAKGVEQPREHYWDVFGHSMNAVDGVERVTSPERLDPVVGEAPWGAETEKRFASEVCDGHSRRTFLKLAGLLHDVAKPPSRTVDSTGRTRFLGHHTVGAVMSRDILGRLRVGNRGTALVSRVVEHHLRPTQMSQGGEMPTARAVHRYFRDLGDAAVDTLYLSLADHLAARGPLLDMDSWRRHAARVAHVLEMGTGPRSSQETPRLVTGHDLMAALDITPGPAIGSILDDIEEARAAGEVSSRAGALALAKRLKDGALDAAEVGAGSA
ncbi:MAG: HD domain-containing protein [Dehalococcoidia bacterium]|nr:HD domain-containing protein [Dehalococcoidia bacterium]